ncbi:MULTISPECIES: hypothetical protein [Catenuloplanes]|uniref:Uncharacterized protein n=1 Tax=Catenuloplanes niger TaxID=587534 RepID=A0AAE3ZMD5_9ACTN|nr:hypothetical protein [Catenuloplanes niger]MDR7322447.1 hypothetical protein [Catenuloplanes niger]
MAADLNTTTEDVSIRLRAALASSPPPAALAALADIPLLLAEAHRLSATARLARMELANLRAAARATLAAHHDGEADPLAYLRDELDATEAGR